MRTEQITVKASLVAIDATFGGETGNFWIKTDEYLPSNTLMTFNIVNNRVISVLVGETLYTHQNSDGANIHGGNHTVEGKWFTFDVNQFRAKGEGGTKHLKHIFETRSAQTFTVIVDGSVPCFVEGTNIEVELGVYCPVETLMVGDKIMTDRGFCKILWIGSKTVPVTEKTQAYRIDDLVVSQQHRISHKNGLIAAKHHPDAVKENVEGGKITYWHFLLDKHAIVNADGVYAESLWPGSECMKMLGDEIGHLIDVEEYCKHPAAPFLNKHGKVRV